MLVFACKSRRLSKLNFKRGISGGQNNFEDSDYFSSNNLGSESCV